jgi:hypothetical protein
MRTLLSVVSLAFLLSACADFQAASRWRSHPVDLGGPEETWNGSDEEKFDGLTLRSLNDDEQLYLSLSADSAELKQGLAGRRPWSLNFKPSQARKNEWGLRVQHTAPHQAQLFVSGVGPSGADFRPVVDADGIVYAEQERSGRLSAELKVPLHAADAQSVAVGCEPGEQLRLELTLPVGGPIEAKGSRPRNKRGGQRGGMGAGSVPGLGSMGAGGLSGFGGFGGNMIANGMNGAPPDESNVVESSGEGQDGPSEAVLEGSVRLAKKPLYPAH